MSPSSTVTGVQELPTRLWVHHGPAPRMSAPHRHDDIEVNVVLGGRLEYLLGGTRLSVTAGHIVVFWAAAPHRLLEPLPDDASTTHGGWLHVPLTLALRWGLPQAALGRLLRWSASVAPVTCLPYDPGRMFEAWADALSDPSAATALRHTTARPDRMPPDEATDAAPALLEVQALLRRVLAHRSELPGQGPNRTDPTDTGPMSAGVAAMAGHIVEHFRRPLSIEDIAAAAHLNRTYAADVFRRSLGITPGGYLSRCRVAEAQRLLITTDQPIAAIVHAAGFSSQSSFYAQFTRSCGVSPGVYRRGRHGDVADLP